MSRIPKHIRRLIKSGSFAEFGDLDNARSVADRCMKLHLVVHGDIDADGETGKYWVVLPADAQRLATAGYEII